MTVQRSRKSYASKPIQLPKSPEEVSVAHLPNFGPGIEYRISLNHWPAFQKARHVQALPPQLPAHERINQKVVYVEYVGPPPTRETADLWQCLTCPDQPELLQPAMMVHMRQVHHIDTVNATGTKELLPNVELALEHEAAFEYLIDGLRFIRYERKNKKKVKA